MNRRVDQLGLNSVATVPRGGGVVCTEAGMRVRHQNTAAPMTKSAAGQCAAIVGCRRGTARSHLGRGVDKLTGNEPIPASPGSARSVIEPAPAAAPRPSVAST